MRVFFVWEADMVYKQKRGLKPLFCYLVTM